MQRFGRYLPAAARFFVFCLLRLGHFRSSCSWRKAGACFLPFLFLSSISFAQTLPPLLIAHVMPTTGRFALHAEADRRGVEMAIEDFGGKILGRDLVLLTRNATTDPAQAAEIAESLITQNHIAFMVGAIDSGVAAAMSAVCQKYGVIFINTNSSSPSEAVENAHRTKFVFDANGANFNKALLKYALDRHPRKRAILLTEDNVWGHSNAAASRGYIERYGGSVVEEVVVPVSLPDPAGLAARIAAMDIDVVAVNLSGNNQIRLFAQIDPALFERQSWVVGEVDWEELYPAPGTPRPLFGTTWAWNLDTPGTAEFVARYRQRYGNTVLDYPGDVTHAAYLAMRALLQAIERAGTTHNHAVIRTLETMRWSARERMQHDDAYMDPASHHLQQSVYTATWRHDPANPAAGIKILGHLSPEEARYEGEDATRLESFEETPSYTP